MLQVLKVYIANSQLGTGLTPTYATAGFEQPPSSGVAPRMRHETCNGERCAGCLNNGNDCLTSQAPARDGGFFSKFNSPLFQEIIGQRAALQVHEPAHQAEPDSTPYKPKACWPECVR